jgi:hypothetical protein
MAVLLFLTSGCGRSESERSDQSVGETAAAKNQQHDHDHEHHHHARPAHKPDNFQQLPTELRRMLIADESGAVRPSRRRQQQLREIVGWIPELTADSDLRRADFDTAVAQQPKLQRVLDQIAAGRSPDMTAWNAAVDQLQQLADQLKTKTGIQQQPGSAQ